MHNRVLLLWAAVLLAITAARDNQTSVNESKYALKTEIAQLIKDEFAEIKSQIGAQMSFIQKDIASNAIRIRELTLRLNEQEGRAMCRQPWNGLGKAACAFTDTGAPWTVIQRRTKGDVSFSRGWKEYEQGFGDITGDYWIGLKAIYELCPQNHPPCEVRFEFTHHGKISSYSEFRQQASGHYVATYSTFRVSPSWYYYKLNIEHFHRGSSTADDDMNSRYSQNGKYFSTIDKDNDESLWNCARKGGGWWFSGHFCGSAWLNGGLKQPQGIHWARISGISGGTATSSQISVRLRT